MSVFTNILHLVLSAEKSLPLLVLQCHCQRWRNIGGKRENFCDRHYMFNKFLFYWLLLALSCSKSLKVSIFGLLLSMNRYYQMIELNNGLLVCIYCFFLHVMLLYCFVIIPELMLVSYSGISIFIVEIVEMSFQAYSRLVLCCQVFFVSFYRVISYYFLIITMLQWFCSTELVFFFFQLK